MHDIYKDQFYAACNVGQDPPPMDLHKKRGACRYYQTGSCRRGSNCPFAHFPVAAPIETPTTAYPAYQADQMYTYHPLGQTPAYHPLGLQAHPAFLWQPYLPISPSFDPWYGHACQAETCLDYPDDKSDPSSAESSSAATSRDYQLCMPLDPTWLEGADLGIRAIASLPGNAGANSRPEYAGGNPPAFPGVKSEYVARRVPATPGQYHGQGAIVALSSPPSLSRQDDQRKKPLAYKTKPCKFYAKNGKCTSGEKCTFIHDPGFRGNDSVEISPIEPPPAIEAKLPPKPLNKYEASRARGFYPITWRVIGGGVMMGGQRQACPAFAAGHCKRGDDCTMAHETEVETDRVGFIEPKSDDVQGGHTSTTRRTKTTVQKRSSSQRRKGVKMTFAETQQREKSPLTVSDPPKPNRAESSKKKATEVVQVARDAPISPVHRRTQSLTIVVSSPPPLDTTHTNYAAEL